MLYMTKKQEDTTNSVSVGSSSRNRIIQRDVLSQLSNCQTGTCARKVLSSALLQKEDTFSASASASAAASTAAAAAAAAAAALYQSISIPKGASSLTISDAELAIQTNIRNTKYSIMELIDLKGDADADRASFSLLFLFVASSFLWVGLSQWVGGIGVGGGQDNLEIWRFVLVWILNFAPLIFVGYGLVSPQSLQTVLMRVQCAVFPSSKQRMIHHEAGHFLMAHLLGYPIRGYGTGTTGNGGGNGMSAAVEFYPLRDDDVGIERASLLGFDANNKRGGDGDSDDDAVSQVLVEDRPYFSNAGRGKDVLLSQSVLRKSANSSSSSSSREEKLKMLTLPPKDDVKKSWPFRGLDHDTLDRLTVVSVAGVCSEILSHGNAEGGYADFAQLRALMESAEPELTEKEMENRIRYAIGFTMGQLRRHLGVLDALVEAMEKGATVEECILAVECCDDVSGVVNTGMSVGTYEKQRRQRIQRGGDAKSWFESAILFLTGNSRRGDKNADAQDDTVLEGRGGGDRTQQPQKFGIPMSGDDPLYAALAVALIFLVYATNGGISLH